MLKITTEHIKELADLYGENVLVPMPCEHPPAGSLWVIATTNKHYDGAATVYATGAQVADLKEESDCDEDGDLTDAGAERILAELRKQPAGAAYKSAQSLAHPGGYTERVMRELSED